MLITLSVTMNLTDECELPDCAPALLLSMECLKPVLCVASSPRLMLNSTFPECLSREQHGAEGFFNFLESEQINSD